MPCREQARWTPFWQCVEALERPEGLITRVFPEYNNSVAQARNIITREALACGAQAIFWLDDDLMFRPDVLIKMLAHPEEIVIGLTLMRAPRKLGKFQPIWSNTEMVDGCWNAIEQLELESNGMMRLTTGTGGGVLTRRRVFEETPAPWWQIGQIESDMFWEDIFFYNQARAAGFKVWGDPKIGFGHFCSNVIWPCRDNATGELITGLANGWEVFLTQRMFEPQPALVGV